MLTTWWEAFFQVRPLTVFFSAAAGEKCTMHRSIFLIHRSSVGQVFNPDMVAFLPANWANMQNTTWEDIRFVLITTCTPSFPRRLSSLVRALAILGVVRALDIFAQMLLVFWGRKRINRLPGEHGSTFATCC